MDFLNECKQRSVKKAIVPALLILAIAFLIGGVFGAQKLPKILSPVSYEDVCDDIEAAEGEYVEMNIQFLYGWYCQTAPSLDSDLKDVKSREYIVDANDAEYIGVNLPKKYLTEAEQLLSECEDYFSTGDASGIQTSFKVCGTIERMDADSESYYKQYVGYNDDDSDAEYQAMFQPYILNVSSMGGDTTREIWSGAIAVLVGILWAVILLIRRVCGSGQKQMKAVMQAEGDLEITAQNVASFVHMTEPVHGVRANERWIFYEAGGKQVLLAARDVVWMYNSVTRRRYNGIPAGKTFQIIFRTAQGKQYSMVVKKEKQMSEILAYVGQRVPGIVIGYQDSFEKLYKQNPTMFAQTILADQSDIYENPEDTGNTDENN